MQLAKLWLCSMGSMHSAVKASMVDWITHWSKFKAAVASIAVLLVAQVWQWTSSIDIQEFYKGKRIILTGASRGIGKHLAIRLAQLEAKLVIAARTADKLAETKQECEHYISDVHTVIADVAKEEDCREIVNKAVDEFGGIDVLILNAAITPTPRFFTDTHQAEFSEMFNVNVLQSVHLVYFALPHLNTSRGSIVPVSSTTGFASVPKVAAYAMTKHALQGFFKSLNQEFILTGTPVSITIMPLPYILTEKAINTWKPIGTWHGITTEDCADRMLKGIPSRKLWHYIDWSSAFIGHFYSLFPEVSDWFVRSYLSLTSHVF